MCFVSFTCLIALAKFSSTIFDGKARVKNFILILFLEEKFESFAILYISWDFFFSYLVFMMFSWFTFTPSLVRVLFMKEY